MVGYEQVAMVARLLKLFGSLKLAVVLLTALAVVMAVATVYESAESTRAAVLHIYRSWWFNTLLALLAINVAAAALTRWPWKRKHVGFVITHAGVIVLLAGCAAQFHYGTEGMMEFRVGDPPTDLVRVEEEALTVVVPETGVRFKTVFRARKDGSVKPRAVAPSKDLRLTLEEYVLNSRVRQVVEAGGEEFNPALQFRLRSQLTQQDVTDWLVAAWPELSRAGMGPARVEFVVAGDEEELRRLTAAPEQSAAAPIELLIAVEKGQYRIPVTGNLDKHLEIGDSGLSAHIAGYWPDFQLDENHKPTSVSDEPNNPAAVVILSRGEDEQRWFVFADPHFEPITRVTRGEAFPADVRLLAGRQGRGGSGLTVVLGPDGTLHYAALSKQGFRTGPLKVGEPISPGWMDFEFTAQQYVSNAVVSHVVEPAPAEPEGGFPALKVSAQAGGERRSDWVRFGQPAVLAVGGKTIHLMYSWETMRLPFTVRLEDFVVERDEGSMNVAGWTSKVVFEDHERGLVQRASVWMNHPAWFKGYKFAQASWNPNDLQYTALQVKKDPRFVTWLTWAGAILITGGISIMFYLRGWLQGKDKGGRMKDEELQKKETVTA